jgi:Zn-dependent protease
VQGLKGRHIGGRQGAAMGEHGRVGARRVRVSRFGVAAPRLTAAVAVVSAVVNWEVLLFEPDRVRLVLVLALGFTLAVTVHEFGHFVVGTSRGLDLYVRVGPGFGWCGPMPGIAQVELSPWGQVVFAAAGPLANLSFYVLLAVPAVASSVASMVGDSVLGEVVEVARVVSLPIGLFNLLPLGVLDGGRIVQAAIDPLAGRSRVLALRSFQAFTVAACAVLVRETWMLGLPGWWAVTNTVVFVFIGGGVLVEDRPAVAPGWDPLVPRSGQVAGRRRSMLIGVAVLVAAIGTGLLVGSLLANQLLGQ